MQLVTLANPASIARIDHDLRKAFELESRRLQLEWKDPRNGISYQMNGANQETC